MGVATQQLGKYQILEERGHGGFGTVFKALDTSLGRQVALKVLDPLLARDPSFIERFKQEARVTAGFFHPNIAVVFEVGEADGRQFIAMQYVPGHNLRDILDAEGPLPFDRIVSIVRQIGAALDYAHAHGAIHRDVKPSNILVDADGHATLTDFGIAKALEGTLVHTTSRAVMGTPYYASPEQAESKPLDGRSDLYSLGIVAYELCTQRVPFSADTTPSLLYKIVHEAALPPSEANPRAAGPIEQVLLKAIARQPEQRYQTGREFADALAAAVQQVQGAPAGPGPRARRVRVAGWILALVGLIGVAAIAIAIIWLSSPELDLTPSAPAPVVPSPKPAPTLSPPATVAPPGREVTGIVLCGTTPEPGIRVVLVVGPNGDPDGPPVAEAVTRPDGRFVLELERPPSGSLTIAARPSGEKCMPAAGGIRDVTIGVEPRMNVGELRLIRRLQHLEPPPGVRVSTTPTLIWASCGTTSYRALVREAGAPPDTPPFRVLEVTSTSVVVTPPLTPGKDYQWFVEGLFADRNEVVCRGESNFVVQGL